MNAQASSRTLLELVATLMEASFAALGEGVILGTMPAYLERFGKANAQYMNRHFVECHPEHGATSSLTPMNFISRITDTPFDMVTARRDTATKRLKSCEFLDAFDSRGQFPKTMICMLHKAAYQGSVNGTLPAESPGYDVEVASRILFGDPHCDFVVTARDDLPADPDKECPTKSVPSGDERENLAYGFYTFILTSFVDYLTHHLPREQVQEILRDCAAQVGGKVYALMDAVGLLSKDAPDAATQVLRLGGRTVERDGADVTVTACPQAPHIANTAQHDPERQREVALNACRLCKNLVQGAVNQVAPGCRVERDGALSVGDPSCGFRVEAG